MGQVITGMIAADDQIEIVAGIDPGNQKENTYPVFKSLEECTVEADVVIDFTNAAAVEGLLDYCVERQIPVAVCTTGLSKEQVDYLHKASEKVACEPGTRTFCIHVSCEEGDQEDFPDSVSLPTLMHMDGEHGVKHYFEEILSAHWSENSYKQERLSALFNLLILELANSQNKQRVSQSDLADKAIEIITATPHHRFQAKEVAQALFVSERTLNNAMNQKTGMPFYAYQKNLKLEMAALQLVMEPDLRLSEIATAFGFHDQFHLSNAFKQKFGMSPQQYRQLKRLDEN